MPSTETNTGRDALTVPMVFRNSDRFFRFALDRIDLAMVLMGVAGGRRLSG